MSITFSEEAFVDVNFLVMLDLDRTFEIFVGLLRILYIRCAFVMSFFPRVTTLIPFPSFMMIMFLFFLNL